MAKLHELRFDNTYARLPPAFYSKLAPTPLAEPHLVSFNPAAAELIGLDASEAERPEFVEAFGGKSLPRGAEPLAMLYAGHQFGAYVPQLGDGRAILLGEVRGPAGDKWDLHLKGSGPTPYSRGFDGRAVLRSTVREYLCGEALHGLGVPTTRALCIVGSSEPVVRERVESAAALVRLSPSHVRFGTFEVFHRRAQHAHVRQLADYVIGQHFPELSGLPDGHARFFSEVATRTARLIAMWQAHGFAHGVMNTDNMSILGLTIDYGPFGFIDDFDPGYVCNHSDYAGRYAFDQQPAVGLWNLTRLAEALSTLLAPEQIESALQLYPAAFANAYADLMRRKLGLREERPADAQLVARLLELLQRGHVDYPRFFRALGDFQEAPGATNETLRVMFDSPADFDAWAADYRARLSEERSEPAARKALMDSVNPKYVLRNYLAQNAITRAEGRDYSEIQRLLELLSDPFAEHPGMEDYAAPPPAWGRGLVLSCSS
ncbi:MAG TPA: YdiU family protein [Pyrinomonadaceae bacterium]